MTAVLYWIAILQAVEEPATQSPGLLGWLWLLFPSWWLFAVQLILIIHLIRRGGSFYWIWLILAMRELGVLIYVVVEVLPDFFLVRDTFNRFGRRKMISRVELALLDNPSAGNYEELAELYFDQKDYRKARDAYNHAVAVRADSLHTFYGRANCALELGDGEGALADLEHVVTEDGKFANYRAASLLAHAYALTGRSEDANAMYDQIMPYSPTLETMFNYAWFLKSQGHFTLAREWIDKMMQKKRTMPRFFQRRERPLFRKAAALLKEMKA